MICHRILMGFNGYDNNMEEQGEWVSEWEGEWVIGMVFSLLHLDALFFFGKKLSRKKSCKVLNDDLIPLRSCDSCGYPYSLPLTTCVQIISLSEILCPDLSSHNVFLLHTKVHHPLAPPRVAYPIEWMPLVCLGIRNWKEWNPVFIISYYFPQCFNIVLLCVLHRQNLQPFEMVHTWINSGDAWCKRWFLWTGKTEASPSPDYERWVPTRIYCFSCEQLLATQLIRNGCSRDRKHASVSKNAVKKRN